MKAKELQQKSDDELQKLLQESKAQVVESKFSVLGGNMKEVKGMRSIKKDIARIFTLMQERRSQQ